MAKKNPASVRSKAWGLLLLPLAALLYIFFPPVFRSGAEVTIPVYSRATAREIAARLRREGILTARLPFRVLCKWTGVDRRLKAGLYRLSPRMSLWATVRALVSGKSDLLTLRVPEGWTAAQVAAELERLNIMPAATFLSTIRDADVAKDLGVPGPQLEGYLFPETYRVPLGAAPKDLATLMVGQFREVAGSDFAERAKGVRLTPYQVVILASLVEKEARLDSERALVAGVIRNRMKKRMRLEVNATLNYVLEDRRSWLTFKQLATDSPYNTYQHGGLPPTPICNPGRASLEAALEPAVTPFLYYVARGDGSHLFAETFERHQANIRLAKLERRKARQARTQEKP